MFLGERRWIVLVVTTTCVSLVFINGTLLPVALPTIKVELGFSDMGLTWIINAYLLAIIAFVFMTGRAGDIFGLKVLVCTGLSILIVGSILCSVSFAPWWLISGRVVQGIGASMILPMTGALIMRTFPARMRGKALGLNVSVGSLFLVSGPLIGGVFTEYLSWRYVFWLNIPLALFAFFWALFFLKLKKDDNDEGFDVFGGVTLAIGVILLTMALMEGARWGWISNKTLFVFLGGLAFFVAFFLISQKAKHPLIDFSFFRSRLFNGGNVTVFLAQWLLMVAVFWAIYFQVGLGYTPAEAGAIVLVGNFPVLFFAPIAGHLADKKGPLLPVCIGFALIAFSLTWLAFVCAHRHFWLLFPGLVPFGCGVPMVFSPSFVAAMHSIPQAKIGSAAGVILGLRQFAATLGLAVFSAIVLSLLKLTDSHKIAFQTVNLVGASIAIFGFLASLYFFRKSSTSFSA